MITNTKQQWTPGQTVKVGFLSLRVVQAVPTPGDHAPDAYVLISMKGTYYRFVPHNGIVKCRDLADALGDRAAFL